MSWLIILAALLSASALGVFSQCSGIRGNVARYVVELKLTGLAGPYTGPPPACPGALRNGSDTLTGVVAADKSHRATWMESEPLRSAPD